MHFGAKDKRKLLQLNQRIRRSLCKTPMLNIRCITVAKVPKTNSNLCVANITRIVFVFVLFAVNVKSRMLNITLTKVLKINVQPCVANITRIVFVFVFFTVNFNVNVKTRMLNITLIKVLKINVQFVCCKKRTLDRSAQTDLVPNIFSKYNSKYFQINLQN